MAIGPLMDVSALSVDHLYDLYLAIATSDHAFRIQSIYGSSGAPQGHCEFRPLKRETFTQRVLHYDSIDGGEPGQSLRQRLARQAFAYGVGGIETNSMRCAA